MLHPRFRTVVFAFFMALFMSGFMSLVISIFNVGLIDNIATIWLKAWAFAFCVAFPAFVHACAIHVVHALYCFDDLHLRVYVVHSFLSGICVMHLSCIPHSCFK